MKVHLAAIPDEGLSIAFQAGDAIWDGLKEMMFEAYPEGDLFVEKRGQDVFIKGRFSATAILSCSRCLDNYPFPVDVSLRHTLQPSHKGKVQGEDQELFPEDLEYGYYEDDIIQLDRLIEEHFILSVPMKPLCKQECQGLCPNCGLNRNISVCQCLVNGKGSPFEVLKNLFPQNR